MGKLSSPPDRGPLMAAPPKRPVSPALSSPVTVRACDQCGYAHDGGPISRAKHQVDVYGGTLYFCNHHFEEHAIEFIANNYRCIRVLSNVGCKLCQAGENMGKVESGVYVTFEANGITKPTTAVECLAVRLAEAIDSCKYAKDLPPLAARLTEVMDRVVAQPTPVKDNVEEMAGRY